MQWESQSLITLDNKHAMGGLVIALDDNMQWDSNYLPLMITCSVRVNDYLG